VPGKEGTQPKDIRSTPSSRSSSACETACGWLEQKINGHPTLSPEEKLELQAYVKRCYGSRTTFNILFATRANWFVGQGDRDA
jgi:hypothetical protein